MTIVDKSYQEQLEYLHQSGKFNNGAKAYELVKDFINEYRPNNLLDFGCGQGGLIAKISQLHPGIQVYGYDPGNERFKILPKKRFDVVVSTDALEHVEPHYIGSTLRELDKRIGRSAFLRIACYPAKKSLPDGRNAHLIVQPPDWWRQQLLANMQVNIIKETISIVDKTSKWSWVQGHNYDVVLEKLAQ